MGALGGGPDATGGDGVVELPMTQEQRGEVPPAEREVVPPAVTWYHADFAIGDDEPVGTGVFVGGAAQVGVEIENLQPEHLRSEARGPTAEQQLGGHVPQGLQWIEQ